MNQGVWVRSGSACDSVGARKTPAEAGVMPPEGLERTRFPSGFASVAVSGGSKSGNNGAGPVPATPPTLTDPDLAAVLAAWPDMSAALRAGIVAMVRAATP